MYIFKLLNIHIIIQSTWYACIGWDCDLSLAYIEEPSGIFSELTRFLGTKSTVGIVGKDTWKLSTIYHMCILIANNFNVYYMSKVK